MSWMASYLSTRPEDRSVHLIYTSLNDFLTQYLADVGVVHVRKGLKDFSSFIFSPHHEGIHWTLYVGFIATTPSRFSINP